jgi:DNA-binding IclR family transcriptional regulator
MSGNQSLERGLAILDLLDRAAEPMGIREIAREMKLSPTIVQRLANTLSHSGFIEQVTETRRYRLGYRAMLLGGNMMTEDRLMASANKELALLADKHLLNGYLGVLRDNKAIYLHTVQSSGPVVVRISVGSQVNVHSTALGKVLLAELDNSAVKAVLGKAPYAQFTPHTLTQWSALSSELETVRSKGFAISREENINGVVSFGAIIRDASGKSVAALSAACLSNDRPKTEWPQLIQLVLDAAHRCSKALGYRGAAIRFAGVTDHAA